jgi:hypothetical protein
MPGRVYVYNCYNEPMNSLTVGGASAGSISAWSGPNYQPQSISVPRAKYSAPGQFVIGDVPCQVQWDSLSVTTTITIPTTGVSLDDDLILYVAVNQSILLSTRGYVLNTFPNNSSWNQA